MAAKLYVDEVRNGEENPTPVDKSCLLTNGEENTTQGQLVTPSGASSSCAPDKIAAPDNFVTEVSVPLSASNSGSEPCDRGVAETQTTTTQSPEHKSDECNTSTLRCGEKRARESKDPSDVPVKRRLRTSEDSRKEFLPDYDMRCAELWIDGEMAVCEAYELSKSSRNTQHQHANSSSVNRPLTLSDILHLIQIDVKASYQSIAKMLRLSMERSRADFAEVISRLGAMQRDSRELANEVRKMRADGRLALDAISLMNEKMSVIQRFALDLHRALTTRK